MQGEILSLIVAVSWTLSALCAEAASKRIGQLSVNVIRMVASLSLLALTLLIFTGSPIPMYADTNTWLWLSLSGFVGYVFGDFCLFNAYILIGSRFGQLFMTLAPPTAAVASWLIFGETMSGIAILGMIITMSGIGISILSKENKDEAKSHSRFRRLHTSLPAKGIIFGIGAGIGQGLGLVLSKLGMTYYEQCIPSSAEDVLNIMPFASTFMRAVTGLVGFTLVMLFTRKTRTVIRATHDGKAMAAMAGLTMFGPFIGVSLSLMATLYTNPGIAQTIMAISPILILVPAYFLFHQKITMKEIIGAIISVFGVTLFFV